MTFHSKADTTMGGVTHQTGNRPATKLAPEPDQGYNGLLDGNPVRSRPSHRSVGGMDVKRTFSRSVLLILVFSLAGARPALAYIDPNAGGMLFQVLAAAFASLSAIPLRFSRQDRMRSVGAVYVLRSLSGAAAEPSAPRRPAPPSPPSDRDQVFVEERLQSFGYH
jgi:hypothetical protein